VAGREAHVQLLDEPVGYYPRESLWPLVESLHMRLAPGHGQNHWELLLGDPGVKLVAAELRHALGGLAGSGDGR